MRERFGFCYGLQRLTKGNMINNKKWTVNLTENAARL